MRIVALAWKLLKKILQNGYIENSIAAVLRVWGPTKGLTMAGENVQLSAPASEAAVQVETALDKIGVTTAHKLIVLLVLFGVMFDVFEQNTVGLIAPFLREQWHLSAADIGFLNTMTFVAAAMGRLGSGVLADRVGRRFMLNVNLLLFTVGAAICALAPGYTTMAIGRFIVGLGLGGEIVTAVTLLAEFCSSKFRGTAVGLINVGGGGLGNMLAPAFALLIFTLFPGGDGWRWLFGALVLPAVLVVFYRRFVPETPRFLVTRGRVAEANRVLSQLATGSFSTKNVRVTDHVTSQPVIETPRLGAIVADIFRRGLLRRTLAVGIASWMTFGAQLTVLTLMPTILVSQGHTITRSFLYTIILQSGSLFGALTAAVLAARVPRKIVLTTGALCAVAAGLGFGFLATTDALILAFGAAFQFFVLLLNTTIWIFAPENYPTRVRGFGTAFILALGTMAGAWMPLLAGRVFDMAGVAGMFTMMAGMYAIFAIAVQFAPETFGKSMEAVPETAPAERPLQTA
ncbi:MFS transporter [Xanthobacter aminoxidans]|uniref:MFS transporter n=1 Tax=Xanthobacter aminoxidans TaxID=186280 RepID=A0ABW6ZA91_9HYPH